MTNYKWFCFSNQKLKSKSFLDRLDLFRIVVLVQLGQERRIDLGSAVGGKDGRSTRKESLIRKRTSSVVKIRVGEGDSTSGVDLSLEGIDIRVLCSGEFIEDVQSSVEVSQGISRIGWIVLIDLLVDNEGLIVAYFSISAGVEFDDDSSSLITTVSTTRTSIVHDSIVDIDDISIRG